MHIKKRGQLFALYRSRWIPKGPGVPHGYAVQEYVGSLAGNALEVPQPLRERLTSEELAQLEAKVCKPARLALQQVMEQAQLREKDPVWRIQEAQKLVIQAANRSEERKVSRHYVDALQRELARVQLEGPVAPMSPAKERTDDALLQAVKALRAAAQALRDGAYGRAPASGVRETRTYRLWADIVDAVEGETGSLLKALQDKGFAKSRKS